VNVKARIAAAVSSCRDMDSHITRLQYLLSSLCPLTSPWGCEGV